VEQHIAVLSNLASDARWLGADGHDLQEAIVRAGDSLRDRVNQVSNDPRKMSKLEETPNFGQWLKENLAWVDLIFAEHQIRLKWPADAVPLRSYLADLSVVMHELLQNALCGIVAKGEQPDRRICVSITQADPQTVKVVVEDNGCGIMSSVLESGEIFKAEYTAWPPEVSKLLKIEHKGLGLNFVRQIINQIGGRIRVENVGGEEGSGLRVELSVPSIESTALPPGNAV
jgi:C4-dicarboxylate-specific signal transduction histidine kinase